MKSSTYALSARMSRAKVPKQSPTRPRPVASAPARLVVSLSSFTSRIIMAASRSRLSVFDALEPVAISLHLAVGLERSSRVAFVRAALPPAARSDFRRRGPWLTFDQILTRRNRSALLTTDTELSAIAALAIIGLSRIPNHG